MDINYIPDGQLCILVINFNDSSPPSAAYVRQWMEYNKIYNMMYIKGKNYIRDLGHVKWRIWIIDK